MNKNRKRTTIIAVIILVILGGAAVGYYMYNKKPEQVENLKGETVHVSELYKSDSVFSSQYLGKVIIVSGTITEKSQNQDSTLMIILQGNNADEVVQCSMRDKGDIGAVGETITIKGFCSDKNMFGVLLTGCVVEK
jgi:flagellar basal body-associated protein FliL